MNQIPFVAHQPFPEDKEVDYSQPLLAYYMRYTYPDPEPATAEGRKVRLEIMKAEVMVDDIKDNLQYDVVRHLLANGEQVGKVGALTECNALASRIAYETRRGAGNTFVVHFEDVIKFYEFWKIFQWWGQMNLWMVETPELKGKVILSYKGQSGEIDGSPVVVTHKGKIGIYDHDTPKYVKVFDL